MICNWSIYTSFNILFIHFRYLLERKKMSDFPNHAESVPDLTREKLGIRKVEFNDCKCQSIPSLNTVNFKTNTNLKCQSNPNIDLISEPNENPEKCKSLDNLKTILDCNTNDKVHKDDIEDENIKVML